MEPVYEVRLSGRDVKIDRVIWDRIRDCARGHKFFYVVHEDKTYRYDKVQTFYDRPTRFDFELLDSKDEGVIEYIYI